ncbi:MAG: hypothetical protein R6U39_06795 [Candidatus Aegiribacteria sp.]
MTITARKHALLSGISPGRGQMAGLCGMELAAMLSWTVLMQAVLWFLSGSWFPLLPVSYLFAATLLAWLERPERVRRHNDPLEALGLAEISLDGSRPSQWQTFRRVVFTPPLILLFCAGLIRVPGTGRTVLQIISGTRIVPLDESMDPRPDEEIFRSRKTTLMKVIAYTMFSLMMAAVIVFVPPRLDRGRVEGRIASVHGLPEDERQLLMDYLEMRALYPDCLEVRVRLASLYYRNNMEEDLLIELAHIRRKDPDHAILILEEDLTVDMEDLLVSRDSSFTDSIQFLPEDEGTLQEQDTADTPSEESGPDPVNLDLTPVGTDTMEGPPDTLTGPDTIRPDSLPQEAETDSIPPPPDAVTDTTGTVIEEPEPEPEDETAIEYDETPPPSETEPEPEGT